MKMYPASFSYKTQINLPYYGRLLALSHAVHVRAQSILRWCHIKPTRMI